MSDCYLKMLDDSPISDALMLRQVCTGCVQVEEIKRVCYS